MKLLLTILACLIAASAGAQTVKSLGYNTTNGQVVYGGSNSLTFTNALQFSTNARAATRTNLGGTTVGNSVFTATNAAAAASAVGLGWSALTNAQSTLYSGQATQLLGYAPEIAGGSTNPTGFNVLAYTNTNGLVIPANILIGEDQTSGGPRNVRNVTVNGAVTIQYPFSSPTTIYGNNSITATDASTYTNTLATWNSNTVTFSNVTASGTLAVTGNVTLSGVNNTMPGATNAASASSLMTRDLSDDRYTTYVWLTGASDNQTITNGGFKFLGPSRINSFSLGYGASVPAGYTKFRVLLNFGWLTDPATNSSNFQVFVRFNNMGALSTSTQESEHGSVAGVSLYPTNSPTNGLVGTLTRLGVVNTTNSIYSFRSEYETIPAAWQNNAASNGFFHLQGVAIRNNTGASVTDAFNANHAPVGIIEFRK